MSPAPTSPETIQTLNEFISLHSRICKNILGSSGFANVPVFKGSLEEFFTAVYIQQKAALVIGHPEYLTGVFDSEVVRMFTNRKVLTDMGAYTSTLVKLQKNPNVLSVIRDNGFDKMNPNETFCADLMEAFTGSNPVVKNALEIEREKLDTECEWFQTLPHRQQYQCLLKALAGIFWLRSVTTVSWPVTQAQADRAWIISRFLSNTAGLEPTTYIEWSKGG